MPEGFRKERDPLGELDVPGGAYYGVQTARAVENFPISGLRAPDDLIVATILIKKAAAETNAALGSLARKADEFAHVLKTGRTHLQDAVPITLGQELSGYADCVRRGADDVTAASAQLHELNIGATAVGTGLNAGGQYRRSIVANLGR